MQHRCHAFTFVEIMLVAVTICILAAIAVPNFLEARVRGVVSRSHAELALTRMTLETYRLETRAYPPNRVPGHPGEWDLTCLTTPVPYISHLPADPFTTDEGRVDKQMNPPLAPIPFQYLNGLAVSPEAGLRLDGPRPLEMDGFLAGVLWGYGPAGVLSPRHDGYFTRLGGPGEVTPCVYDPTNGTTSVGDLYTVFP